MEGGGGRTCMALEGDNLTNETTAHYDLWAWVPQLGSGRGGVEECLCYSDIVTYYTLERTCTMQDTMWGGSCPGVGLRGTQGHGETA